MWMKIKNWFGKKQPQTVEMPGPAKWIPADKNPFGVPVLDLIAVTGGLISSSQNLFEAETAISWNSRLVKELSTEMKAAKSLPCNVRYPADPDLQDGWLFCPSRMEEKWAIAYRAGKILLLRSWTGNLVAIGESRRQGEELVVECVHVADNSLDLFGETIPTFDWLLRSHALQQVDEAGGQLLESAPIAVFGPHGQMAAYAAMSWAPSPPNRPLRATSDLVTAVRLEQPSRVAECAAAGCSLNTRGVVLGLTALHTAAIKGSVDLTRQLLDLGANPNVLADRNASVLMTAIVHKGPLELLKLLAAHGADLRRVNMDGFGALHALAEVNDPTPLTWLLEQGLDLEARTNKGHTPLHIAAALGNIEALHALLAAGADSLAESPKGNARDLAIAERKTASVEALDAHARKA
jgi:hypothetical protein